MKRSILRRATLALCIAVASIQVATAQDAATWSDTSGKFKIEASFVKLDGTSVVLRKPDGSTIAVPLSKLSSTSQQMAKKMAEQASMSKKESAPASSASSSASSGLNAGMSAKEFVEYVQSRIVAKDTSFAWDLLPASYQSDVNEVVAQLGQKLDPQLHSEVVALKNRVIKILRDKKKFLLNSTAFPPLADPKVAKAYDPVVNALEAGLAVEKFSPEQLKKGDVKTVLNGYVASAVPAFQTLGEALESLGVGEQADVPKLEDITFDVVDVDSDTAKVTPIQNGERKETFTLMRVDGKWLPEQMVKDWDKNVSEAKDAISALTPEKQQEAIAQLKQAGGQLAMLENINSQQQMDQMLSGIAPMFMMMMGGMGGPGFGPPGFGPPGFGGEGPADGGNFDPNSFELPD